MKKFILLLLLFLLFALTSLVHSQNMPPDPPPQHGLNGDQPIGGGAPVSGGVFILIGLAGAYGGYRFYLRKRNSLLD